MPVTSNRLFLAPILVLVVLCAPLVRVVDADQVVPDSRPLPPQPAWDAPHVANELLVKLLNGGRVQLARAGVNVLSEIPELGLAVVRVKTGSSLADAAADLESLSGVEWAEPNYIFRLDFVPNDPYYDPSDPSQPKQKPYLSRIDAEGAWDVAQGRPEIMIAVLDTGVDLAHEDLAGAIWTNSGEIPDNGIDDEGNGFVDDVHGWDFAEMDNDPDDDHGHGTHVSGIAAARTDNGKGIAGLAGQATVMPVDVFQGGIGAYEDLIRAIIYATDNGAHVINMSLGASSYSLGEEMAVDYAFSHGVVVVAAAGNTSSEEYHYPGAHANVIAVASTTADDVLSGFSTHGAWVDVAAPGSSIYSTVRTVSKPTNPYGYLSGTSMATPHVAGLAALILSRNAILTPTQVRDIIESTVDDLGPTGRDIYFGAGRINAGRAVAATPPDDTPPPAPAPGPGLDIDLPGCRELVNDGGFENGLAAWQIEGAVEVDDTIFHAGQNSLMFRGGPGSRGVVTKTLTIPGAAAVGVVKFAYRIDPVDAGSGTDPAWPFDDWFTAEWRTPDGQAVDELLRTGNTADTVNGGLDWDRYLYRIEEVDFSALRAHGQVAMVFTSQNDGDTRKTNIWLDSVQFCVTGADGPLPPIIPRLYLPLWYAEVE